MVEKIYIVRELNVMEETDLIVPMTIWACIGNCDNYIATGTKVAGPVPASFADPMIEGLSALLQQLGHEVLVETTADD